MHHVTSRLALPVALAALLAPRITAADADLHWSGGWDRIELASGAVISGRVLRVVGDEMLIDTGCGDVLIERARVRSIGYGRGAPDPVARLEQPPISSDHAPWSLDAMAIASFHHGTLVSHGPVVDLIGGTTGHISIEGSSDHIDAGPAVRLALSRPLAAGSPLSGGVALEHGMASSADVQLGLWSLEALGGWQFADGWPADAAWQIRLGGGWQWASGRQTLTMSDAGGSPIDRADIDIHLQGPLLLIEAGPIWRLGAWRIGGLGGCSWSSLHGSGDWTSDHGRYVGTLDHDYALTAGYLALTMGIAW